MGSCWAAGHVNDKFCWTKPSNKHINLPVSNERLHDRLLNLTRFKKFRILFLPNSFIGTTGSHTANNDKIFFDHIFDHHFVFDHQQYPLRPFLTDFTPDC